MVRKAGLWCALMCGVWMAGGASALAADTAAVIDTYADIAHAKYEDSLKTAEALEKAIDILIAKPTEENLKAARTAWLAARVPYQQTEGYRFGNPIVDDWEGKVNAWPLDEGLIDYVADTYGTESDANPLYTANVIANTSISFGGETVDTSKITKELLADKLHEAAESEANVATGYHAIEFLLWGQDLNGTGPGAGNRPASDYDTANCTHGNCDRRAAYLKTAASLLVDDLEEMVANWTADGAARKALRDAGGNGALGMMFAGLGSLSYGELAGERMKLGLLLHDPEEEHDCFSDNTHNSHYYDEVGMIAIYEGSYKRTDGSVVKGPSLSELVKAASPDADKAVRAAMADAEAKLRKVKETADSGKMAYDQMIGDGNADGNKMVQDAIDALIAQTRAIEKAVDALKIGAVAIEGSDSLDNPSAVLQ
ncbi:imelysin family protein [Dongia deserti]|uniref:imelysin family protein n=1 Tax=Dongia deserti TaxID=2268030 RepID=UPI000E65BB4E|nr:imelysin family protein [Dongia deserti]